MAPIDRAFVAVLPDFSKFTGEAERGMRRAMVTLAKTADVGADQIERRFTELGRNTAKSFDGIGRDARTGFTSLRVGAEQTATAVERSFDEAARDSRTALVGLGAGATAAWTPLRVSAETTADSISRSFRQASTNAVASFALLRTAVVTGGGLLASALGLLGGAAVTMGVTTAASMERATISFETLLGSGERARRFLADLNEFAAATPFELPGLIASARQLLGAGQAARDIIPTLQAVGDATGALGLQQAEFERIMLAVTQAMNKGRLQGEELMQMQEAGLPVTALLADALGVTERRVGELAAAGKLTADEVLPRLFEQMSKDYGGAMSRQARTLNGRWSTFMDTVRTSLSEAFGPLATMLSERLPAAGEAFKEGVEAARLFVAEDLAPEFERLKRDLDANYDAFVRLLEVFGGSKDTMDTLGTLIHRIGEEVHTVNQLFRTLTDLVTIAVGTLKGLGIALDRLATLTLRAFVNAFLLGFESVLSAATATARALHLPWAKSLENATQDVRDFRGAVNRELGAISDEIVNLNMKSTFTPPPGWSGHRITGALAGGGPVGGTGGPTEDRNLILASRGEWMMPTRAVDYYGRGFMEAVQQLRLPRLAAGGPILQAHLPEPAWYGQTGQAMANAAAAAFLRAGRSLRLVADIGVGGVSGNLAAWIGQAIALTGVPASWAPALARRALFESGGNPRAINLWDINFQRGDPSKGLMQTIGATFNAYKLAGLGDIWNPVHNLVAAIRYILSRYGTIFAIDPPVRGYDAGGLLPPGHAGVNLSGSMERVLSPEQTRAWSAVERALAATRAAGARPAGDGARLGGVTIAAGAVQLNVYGNLDTATLPEVDAKITAAFTELLRLLQVGAGR
jgi:tape measure domain-containing protein